MHKHKMQSAYTADLSVQVKEQCILGKRLWKEWASGVLRETQLTKRYMHEIRSDIISYEQCKQNAQADVELKQVLDDADTVRHGLAIVVPHDTAEKQLSVMEKRLESVKIQLELTGCTPNNNQIALGLAIFHRYVTRKAKPVQIWSMGAGKGKSRVMVIVTALLHSRAKDVDKVVIWFSLPLLKAKDKQLYDNMRDSLFGLDVHLVSSYDEALEKTTKNTLLIIDEVDY